MAFTYEILNKTAAAWAADTTTVPKPGQETLESDTGLRKLGDGVTTNHSLPYLGGGGNVTGQSSSVDSEVALFSGTGGKTIKRSTLTGVPKLTSGVQSGTAAVLGDLGTTGADFSMNNHKLTSVTDPTNPQDASTKNYFDTHQFEPLPSWHGFLGWTFDHASGSANTIIPNAGVMNVAKLWMPGTQTISTIWVYASSVGSGLTNVGFALYDSSSTLLQSSVNANGATTTAFTTGNGAKQVTITPQSVSGSFYVGFWFTGTTMPTLTRGSTVGIININLSPPNLRFATTGSGLTTTAPSPMGTQATNNAIAWWVGVS